MFTEASPFVGAGPAGGGPIGLTPLGTGPSVAVGGGDGCALALMTKLWLPASMGAPAAKAAQKVRMRDAVWKLSCMLRI